MTEIINQEGAKKVEFKDIEQSLKKQYREFIDNPEKFGVPKEELEFMGKDPLTIKVCYKIFKHKAELALEKLNTQQLATILIYDLQDSELKHDGDKLNINASTLDSLLKHPEDAKYHLENEVIEKIQNLTNDEKKHLRKELIENHITSALTDGDKLHISKEHFKDIMLSLGVKLEKFAKVALVVLIPIVQQIIIATIHSSNKIPKAIKDLSEDAVEELGNILATTIKESDDLSDRLSNAQQEKLDDFGVSNLSLADNPEIKILGEQEVAA